MTARKIDNKPEVRIKTFYRRTVKSMFEPNIFTVDVIDRFKREHTILVKCPNEDVAFKVASLVRALFGDD